MKIDDLKKVALPLCHEFDVRRLDVFGSLAQGSATLSSDIDLLVEFNQPEHHPAQRFFGLLHQLEDVLGSKVDLLTSSSLRNPYFKARVLKEKVAIYEG
ncbi:MAG: nucleotidyltransferase domain-containing protein [Desulfurivibrionaceae bacterium]